jgi:hypothetical protein
MVEQPRRMIVDSENAVANASRQAGRRTTMDEVAAPADARYIR